MSEDKIWLEKIKFEQAVKSLEDVGQQLCQARDDSYHRARAEAKNEAYETVIRIFLRESLSLIGDHI